MKYHWTFLHWLHDQDSARSAPTMTEAPPVGAFRSRRGRGALFRQRCGWLTGKTLTNPSRKKRCEPAQPASAARAGQRRVPAVGPSGPVRFSGRPVKKGAAYAAALPAPCQANRRVAVAA